MHIFLTFLNICISGKNNSAQINYPKGPNMVQLVQYYLGKRRRQVSFLQNYTSVNDTEMSDTVRYDEKPYFVGETKDGLAHGRGKLFNIIVKGSLCTYDAEWENGKIRSGKLYKNCGLYVQLIYKGEFNTFFQFHGHGLHLKNDNKYEGNWKNGKKHGHCVVHFSNGDMYKGNFEDNKKHGYGVYTLSNGNRYDGNWKDDKRHGQGVYKSQKSYFKGSYFNDMKSGFGTEISSNGEKYNGSYLNNKRHGPGFLQFSTGAFFTGRFEKNIICGEGILFRITNSIWKEGNFKGIELHGKGTVYAEDGTIQQEGKFIRGKFFDETALMVQKYLETRDCTVLDEISAKEIQKYIQTRFEITFPDPKPKVELLEQLILLSRPSEKLTTDIKYDEFGNGIVTKCLGNDGNTYDITSMIYLFQKNNEGEYTNIPYHYIDEERRPNFPIMGNGKRLDGYQIISEEV